MATRRKKPTPPDLAGNADPRAPLDAVALLDAAKPLLKELAADLLARADGSRAVTEALQSRHAQEQKAERTADAYPEWRRALVEQVGAAWLLSCVFVRTLEDRGLLGMNRIAGAGAQDSWKAFLQLAPSLSEREYLLTVFRELGRLPAAADLFDARHNPVWLLAPSAEGARKLLDLFCSPNADAPQFRFGGDDTRFLGDLYQDLSEDVRKRYALLQTPRFVESFILDRTLEPAIERFGLDDTNLIDPTCGSGHFLLGAFERLFDHRLRAQPGLSAREAATKAVDAVAGSDINPYAVAIARFRLTLAFIEKCGLSRLKDVPRLPLHLAVADSLLYNPQIGQLALVKGTDPSQWEGAHFSLEDPQAARDVLFKQYAAVVGNPPYITVKDPVLRERYRSYYVSAAGKYSLAAPFAERFFQLARDAGSVGMITANSFMKREFGKRLIEEYLRTVNVSLIINTSGAYIPGHGTPTVLLFGTCEKPKGTDVLTVLASRNEPTTPDNPEEGLVWSSIAEHWSDLGFENEYVSVARLERTSLAKHPWSLGGGGAGELKELLEERAANKLGEVVENIGFASFTGLDDAFIIPTRVGATRALEQGLLRPMVIGESVRDWSALPEEAAITPYDNGTQQPLPLDAQSRWARFLWHYRAVAESVASFGGRSRKEEGQNWWEWYRWQPERYLAKFRITFAFVATHNHFVLDRGGKVFSRSAPIITLPKTANEDEHLALLAYLNSSTACFWMKQVFQPKHSAEHKTHPEPERNRFEHAGTQLEQLPVPPALLQNQMLSTAARKLTELGAARAALFETVNISKCLAKPGADFKNAWQAADELRERMVALQEIVDWEVYRMFGLHTPESTSLSIEDITCPRGDRPMERVLGRKSFVRRKDHLVPLQEAEVPPVGALSSSLEQVWAERTKAIRQASELSLLEQPLYKRQWRDTDENIDEPSYRENVERSILLGLAGGTLERVALAIPETVPSLAAKATEREPAFSECTARLSDTHGVSPRELVEGDAVPYLAALRYSDAGLERWAAWIATWDAQRVQDLGSTREAAAPPQYASTDFRRGSFWSLRGKLDVPKERFISYPGCESDENKEPVYGWAGWDHLQRAVALAGLYQDRKQREGWTKDRLKPMLAGLLELLPWLKQWHHEPSAELGSERPSDQFEAFLNAECGEFGFTHDDLRAWRPAAKSRGAKSKPTKKRADDDGEAEA